ncbi:hypothetical protein WA026_008841 [Henosepilachna vigintioctopunctata]|uniref:Uncharacterized protein n=1 Tax=Henosepilachna vigintioctopunctata TaxID=420089 RepID=A0AAW1VA69_9CUCU
MGQLTLVSIYICGACGCDVAFKFVIPGQSGVQDLDDLGDLEKRVSHNKNILLQFRTLHGILQIEFQERRITDFELEQFFHEEHAKIAELYFTKTTECFL